ncbi:ATP-dependent RNA helicase [Streptosporangium carneum]|uniref:ATP-binding RNA helicase n=1 Tax=Streptosporangium carneum TaxID=47481 RepID=A0A9W6I253_9ACTN|nr:ATP-dependent helicase C-terminal domain-containing protein [Streptosporangium carneum]GLK10652.1 ATP-binding RNA helicase [Streptosporangium carneum]
MRSDWSGLPVRHALPELLAALDEHGVAVLTAPPGTGKTTLVPLALAGLVGDSPPRRVVVAEPRRMAVRAAARRMAWLLESEVGAEIGFSVRGERRASARTVVEVVTTGVLLQRLQRDAELDGVDVVLLDECHERHLDADTALAFLLDVRSTLRPDLRLVAASATADAVPWARLLVSGAPGDVPATPTAPADLPTSSVPDDPGPAPGGLGSAPDVWSTAAAPIVHASGVAHPVVPVWAPAPGTVTPPRGLRVDPVFLSHVADVVRRALGEHEGDVLCFLPGVGEIGRVAAALQGSAGLGDVEVLQVHGQAAGRVQDAVLSPGSRRRVVLATSVAESSLTVPGVRIVVDSGLAREPRTDHARGLGSLTTVRVSRASATQRAGRAGREAPGVVYRCWSRTEHDRLPEHAQPEIALADLVGFALQAACWGDPAATGLALLDPPPPAAMDAARRTLHALGALDAPGGRVTAKGRGMAAAGVHPRLARALLDVGAEAAEVIALLSERLPADAGDDLVAVWRSARRGGDGFSARWRQEARRLSRAVPPGEPTSRAEPGREQDSSRAGVGRGAESSRAEVGQAQESSRAGVGRGRGSGGVPLSPGPGGDVRSRQGRGGASVPWHAERGDDALAGLVVALAYPERVARRRGGSYLMASGTAAELPPGSRLGGAEWLAVAVADRPAGSAAARVRQAVVIDEEIARVAAAPLYGSAEEIGWRVPPGERRGDVSARRVERLGAVELSSVPLSDADVRPALLYGLRAEGLSILRWTPEAVTLRERLAFCHRALGDPWPAMDDDSLVDAADLWLEPELSRARRRADLERLDVASALGRLVPWSARLDETAPERIEVPSGSRIRVDYSGEQPVLAVKLQELFGWDEAPRVAGTPLVIHLLSPAGRPAAVTSDLASFWRGDGYRAVRAELRGCYPRHPWPEDPLSAVATRRANPRR